MATFTHDEARLVKALLDQLSSHAQANQTHEKYYDGSFASTLLNISAPEHITRMLNMVSGWSSTAVDVLEERLDLWGFSNDDLSTVFDDNALNEEASQVHLDSMIYGVGFVSVTAGGDGEPDILVRGHDAKNTTGVLNVRTRHLDAGLTREIKNGEIVGVDLWLPDQVVTARRDRDGQPWEVVERAAHGLGAVPLVPFVNRPRTGARWGKSEITAPLRRYTDSAVRTLISMDINREFFSAPQRYAIGLDQDDFVGPDGRRMSQWQIVAGRMWATGAVAEDEKTPDLGEFRPHPAGPFLEQIEGLAQLAAAEAGLPSHYFGLRGEQAASADSIRAMEARLVKRAERRQKSFGRAWGVVGRLALAALGESAFSEVGAVSTRWGDPATPTVGATTDAMVKLAQAGIAAGASRPVWDRVGFTPEEQQEMQRVLVQQQALQRQALVSTAAGQTTDEAAARAALANRPVGETP